MIKNGLISFDFEKLPGMGEMMRNIPKEADDRELPKVQAMINP